jgi:DNA N-6-adenine-methyltransferase (Dam)
MAARAMFLDGAYASRDGVVVALHEQCVGATDEWYTPPEVFEALGCQFDMDVAAPPDRNLPWIPADKRLTADSLSVDWHGFIWMNPPFGGRNGLIPWLDKFVRHANGIALVPDRTSAPWWQQFTPHVESVLFVRKKIKFIGANGQRGASPAQGTCLMAIGAKACAALEHAQARNFGLLMIPAGKN